MPHLHGSGFLYNLKIILYQSFPVDFSSTLTCGSSTPKIFWCPLLVSYKIEQRMSLSYSFKLIHHSYKSILSNSRWLSRSLKSSLHSHKSQLSAALFWPSRVYWYLILILRVNLMHHNRRTVVPLKHWVCTTFPWSRVKIRKDKTYQGKCSPTTQSKELLSFLSC